MQTDTVTGQNCGFFSQVSDIWTIFKCIKLHHYVIYFVKYQNKTKNELNLQVGRVSKAYHSRGTHLHGVTGSLVKVNMGTVVILIQSHIRRSASVKLNNLLLQTASYKNTIHSRLSDVRIKLSWSSLPEEGMNKLCTGSQRCAWRRGR